MMEQREKLIELVAKALDAPRFRNKNGCFPTLEENVADILLANGVVVLPCRCCECKHSIGKSLIDSRTYCMLWEGVFNPDDFCSFGKRKDDIVDLCTTGHLHLGYVEEKGGDE